MVFKLDIIKYQEIYNTSDEVIGCYDMDGEVEYCDNCAVSNCPIKS